MDEVNLERFIRSIPGDNVRSITKIVMEILGDAKDISFGDITIYVLNELVSVLYNRYKEISDISINELLSKHKTLLITEFVPLIYKYGEEARERNLYKKNIPSLEDLIVEIILTW